MQGLPLLSVQIKVLGVEMTSPLSREEWFDIGIAAGWISVPVCETHEVVPMSKWEAEEFDDGYDPCIVVARVYTDHDHKNEVEGS